MRCPEIVSPFVDDLASSLVEQWKRLPLESFCEALHDVTVMQGVGLWCEGALRRWIDGERRADEFVDVVMLHRLTGQTAAERKQMPRGKPQFQWRVHSHLHFKYSSP